MILQVRTDINPSTSEFGFVGANSKKRLDGLEGHAAMGGKLVF